MAAHKYERRGNVIREFHVDEEGNKTHEDHTFPSVSRAKRKSAEWQKANGGLGMGSLKLVEKFST